MRSALSLEAGRPPSLLVRWGAPLASPPRPGSPASFPCPHRAAGKGEAQGARADARAEEEWLGVRRCANWGCGRQVRTPRPAPRSYPTRPGRHLASSTPLLSARGGIRTRRPRGRYPELRPYPRTPPAPWPRPARPRPAPPPSPPRPAPARSSGAARARPASVPRPEPGAQRLRAAGVRAPTLCAPSVPRVRRVPGGHGAARLSAAPRRRDPGPQPAALLPRPRRARAMAKATATAGAAGLRLLLLLPLLGEGESCRGPVPAAAGAKLAPGAERRSGRARKRLSLGGGQRAAQLPAARAEPGARWGVRPAASRPGLGGSPAGTRCGPGGQGRCPGPEPQRRVPASSLLVRQPRLGANQTDLVGVWAQVGRPGGVVPESPRLARAVLSLQIVPSWFPFLVPRRCVPPPARMPWPAQGCGGDLLFYKRLFFPCAFLPP